MTVDWNVGKMLVQLFYFIDRNELMFSVGMDPSCSCQLELVLSHRQNIGWFNVSEQSFENE